MIEPKTDKQNIFLLNELHGALPSDIAAKFATLWSNWNRLHLKLKNSLKSSKETEIQTLEFLTHRARIFSAMAQLLTDLGWRKSLRHLIQEHDACF